MSILEQFLMIVMVHFFAVISPGPDFAFILKQSIQYDRRTAIYSSLGIGAGIFVHITYSLVGIGLLIASDERLFTLLKYIAASYFCYIAWHCIQAKKPKSNVLAQNETDNITRTIKTPSAKKAFVDGFLINALNVKATLFFVSVFSVVIPPDTPLEIKVAFGLYLVIATSAWFCLLSSLLTHHSIRHVLKQKSYIIDRLMGLILLLLAIQLVLSDLN